MQPSEYLKKKCPRLARKSKGCALTIILMGATTAVLGYLAVFSNGPVLAAASAGAVLLFVLLVLCLNLITPDRVRVHPYFEKPVSSAEKPVCSGAAFLSGETIAKELESLDALAGKMGVAPLSAFGFEDDFFGEEPKWHAPEEGLKTVSMLLECVKDQPSGVCDVGGVTKDLKKIANALEDARKRKIRFCFLVRACDATNPMEWEQRNGTA